MKLLVCVWGGGGGALTLILDCSLASEGKLHLVLFYQLFSFLCNLTEHKTALDHYMTLTLIHTLPEKDSSLRKTCVKPSNWLDIARPVHSCELV